MWGCGDYAASRAASGDSGEDLSEPVAVERLDQEAVHDGLQSGFAILAEGIGVQRHEQAARASPLRAVLSCGQRRAGLPVGALRTARAISMKRASAVEVKPSRQRISTVSTRNCSGPSE